MRKPRPLQRILSAMALAVEFAILIGIGVAVQTETERVLGSTFHGIVASYALAGLALFIVAVLISLPFWLASKARRARRREQWGKTKLIGQRDKRENFTIVDKKDA